MIRIFLFITLNLNMRVNEVHELCRESFAMCCGRPVAFRGKENLLHLLEVHKIDCVTDLKKKKYFSLKKMQLS